MTATTQQYAQLDQWIDAHFDEQVKFLQALVQVPTDTPPGNNAPHAAKTTELLKNLGYEAEQFPVPEAEVKAYGLTSLTNLIVRRPFGPGGKTIALNAHGDVVPPGEGWTHPPYGAEIENGHMYGRATAVSKCDFSTFTYALRAVEALRAQQQLALKGSVESHFTDDEEFGGEKGPGWLLERRDPTRFDDCGWFQLPSGHGPQWLLANGSDGSRQDGPRWPFPRPVSMHCKRQFTF